MLLFLVLIFTSTFICSLANTTNKTRNIGHIVLITSPFYGHMIPILDLAKRLAVHHHVTYIVSASKLDILKRRGFIDGNEKNDSSQSKLEIIGLFDGNNDDYEATDSTAINHIQLILDRMRQPLLQLLSPTSTKPTSSSSLPFATGSITRPINLIISDLFILTPVWEGYKRNIITYFFVPNNLKAYMTYISVSVERIKTNEVGLDFDRLLHKTISLSNGLICNSMRELDKQSLKELRQQTVPGSDKPILFVAPLMSEDFHQKQHISDVDTIKQWLDSQWEKANQTPSVIYISFGSWAYLQPKQLKEIIRALKQYPFIWSLKSNLQASISSSSSIDKEKHLLLRWAPQRLILSHPAIRLFISHGGWNSLLEGMLAGKPTLIWPLFGDQIINGQRLEYELGMGRCLQSTDLSNGQRLVSSDELGRYVKEMFDHEKDYVEKARKVQKMMIRARENKSRVDFEKIINIVDNQLVSQTNRRTEL
ncbi:hypothetical protein I4U23_015743 [Adineta vaga]|nr:hypothetical protein I4U23_015743 [Adineta vaga]